MVLPIHSPEQNATPAPSRAGETLLEAKGVRKAFGGQVVLDGVDVRLSAGEVVLLRGENGSGKTTLLNILTGNLQPDAGEIRYLADGTPRTFSFPRRWWQDLNPFDHFVPEAVAREGIGRTWQDVRLFGAQTLRENIVVAEPGHPGENPWTALIAPGRSARKEKQLRDQADSALSRFGLAGREDSSADMISLGQSKRVAIARAVAAGAKILFLDEPLAGLDRQGIDDVLRLLKSLVRDHTLTLVIVEHVFNQPHLRDLVTTDWLLESGKLTNSPRSAPPESSIRNQQSSIPSRPPWVHLLAGDNAEIIDEPLPRGALLTRIRRPDRYNPGSTPALEIRNLVVKRGPRTVVDGEESGSGGMDLAIFPGEIAILQAPNGWGKSSLFGAICGHIHGTGRLLLHGKQLNGKFLWDRARMGLVAVGSNSILFPSLTTSEARSLSRSASGPSTTLRNPSTALISTLSGGERQSEVIDLSVDLHSQGASIAIYDEPFAMLDHLATLAATRKIVAAHSTLLFLVPHSLAQQKDPT